jgi:hypothetical protein
LVINGFLGATKVDSLSQILNVTGPQFINIGFTGVDRVEFSISGGTPAAGLGGAGDYFAADDLDVTVTPGVPEPATWALMLMGFGGLGALLRRRRAGLTLAT